MWKTCDCKNQSINQPMKAEEMLNAIFYSDRYPNFS